MICHPDKERQLLLVLCLLMCLLFARPILMSPSPFPSPNPSAPVYFPSITALPPATALVGSRAVLVCDINSMSTLVSPSHPGQGRPVDVSSSSASSSSKSAGNNGNINNLDSLIQVIIWYKGNITGSPIYSIDARTSGSLESAEKFPAKSYGKRLSLNASIRPIALVIDPVEMEDEGDYFCRMDVRWSQTISAAIKLTVIVPPSSVWIESESGLIQKNSAGFLIEGSDSLIKCFSAGGSPPPMLMWLKNGHQITSGPNYIITNSLIHKEKKSGVYFEDASGSEVSSSGFVRSSSSSLSSSTTSLLAVQSMARNATAISVLLMKNVSRADFNSVLTCSAKTPYFQLSINASVTLDINLKPLSVEITNLPVPLTLTGSNGKLELLCESRGSRPPAQLTWMLGGRILPYSRESYSDDLSVSRSVLEYSPVPAHNGLNLSCSGENPRVPNSTLAAVVPLQVHFKPLVQLLLTDHTASPSSTSSTSSSYVTPATSLVQGTRIVTGSSSSKKAFLDAILKEGTNVTLTCLVLANPNVTSVKWYYNQKLFKTVTVKDNSSSDLDKRNDQLNISIHMRDINQWQQGSYKCIASNEAGSGESEVLRLQVLYSPVCKAVQKLTYEATIGESMKISCNLDAFPKEGLVFQWARVKQMEKRNPSSSGNGNENSLTVKTISPEDSTPGDLFTGGFDEKLLNFTTSGLTSILAVTASEDTAGFLCRAGNAAGWQRDPCFFQLRVSGFRPPAVHSCTTHNVAAYQVTVVCSLLSSNFTSTNASSTNASSTLPSYTSSPSPSSSASLLHHHSSSSSSSPASASPSSLGSPSSSAATDGTYFVLEMYDSISESLTSKIISHKEPVFNARGLQPNRTYILSIFSQNQWGTSEKVLQTLSTRHMPDQGGDSKGLLVVQREETSQATGSSSQLGENKRLSSQSHSPSSSSSSSSSTPSSSTSQLQPHSHFHSPGNSRKIEAATSSGGGVGGGGGGEEKQSDLVQVESRTMLKMEGEKGNAIDTQAAVDLPHSEGGPSKTGSDSSFSAFPILSVICLASSVTVVLFILLITLITYRARKQTPQPPDGHEVKSGSSSKDDDEEEDEEVQRCDKEYHSRPESRRAKRGGGKEERGEDLEDSSPSAIRLGALTAGAMQPSEPSNGSNLVCLFSPNVTTSSQHNNMDQQQHHQLHHQQHQQQEQQETLTRTPSLSADAIKSDSAFLALALAGAGHHLDNCESSKTPDVVASSSLDTSDPICPEEFVVKALTQLDECAETYHSEHFMSRFQDNNALQGQQQGERHLIDSPCLHPNFTESYFSHQASLDPHGTHPTGMAGMDCSLINMLTHGNIQVLPSVGGVNNRVTVLLHSIPEKQLHQPSAISNGRDEDCNLDNSNFNISSSNCNTSTVTIVPLEPVAFDVNQLPTIPEEQNSFITTANQLSMSMLPVTSNVDHDQRSITCLSGSNLTSHETNSSSYCESSTSTASSGAIVNVHTGSYFGDDPSMLNSLTEETSVATTATTTSSFRSTTV